MTQLAALWVNGKLQNLQKLPDSFAAIASGINNRDQVVGSTQDSNFSFNHAFIYEDGEMIDLATLFPASANMLPTMANMINSAGQIVGMGRYSAARIRARPTPFWLPLSMQA